MRDSWVAHLTFGQGGLRGLPGSRKVNSTVVLLHYCYADSNAHYLSQVTLCAVPNGNLQSRYNPTADDIIWLAGRDAPTLGEDFRVRLSFSRLQSKQPWRVQRVRYEPATRAIVASWQDA